MDLNGMILQSWLRIAIHQQKHELPDMFQDLIREECMWIFRLLMDDLEVLVTIGGGGCLWRFTGWWLNHPFEKYESNWKISPGSENKKYTKCLKPPLSLDMTINLGMSIQSPMDLEMSTNFVDAIDGCLISKLTACHWKSMVGRCWKTQCLFGIACFPGLSQLQGEYAQATKTTEKPHLPHCISNDLFKLMLREVPLSSIENINAALKYMIQQGSLHPKIRGKTSLTKLYHRFCHQFDPPPPKKKKHEWLIQWPCPKGIDY